MLFYILVLQIDLKNGQKRRRWYLSEEKNRRITKQYYHNNICRWKRNISVGVDVFSIEAEITMGIACIKI